MCNINKIFVSCFDLNDRNTPRKKFCWICSKGGFIGSYSVRFPLLESFLRLISWIKSTSITSSARVFQRIHGTDRNLAQTPVTEGYKNTTDYSTLHCLFCYCKASKNIICNTNIVCTIPAVLDRYIPIAWFPAARTKPCRIAQITFFETDNAVATFDAPPT